MIVDGFRREILHYVRREKYVTVRDIREDLDYMTNVPGDIYQVLRDWQTRGELDTIEPVDKNDWTTIRWVPSHITQKEEN